jgi:hypothetical protein
LEALGKKIYTIDTYGVPFKVRMDIFSTGATGRDRIKRGREALPTRATARDRPYILRGGEGFECLEHE